jgi:hypothetical protein
MSAAMDWILTLAAIGACVVLTVFAGWKSGRPRKDSLNAQWISWPLVTVIAGAALVFAIVHAVNLMGVNTGDNFRHRLGY